MLATAHSPRRLAALVVGLAVSLPGLAGVEAAGASVPAAAKHRAHKVTPRQAVKARNARHRARVCRRAAHPARCARTNLSRMGRDRSAPAVRFVAPTPAAGTEVRPHAAVGCRAKATDDRKISKVVFFVDQAPVATDRVAPYQCHIPQRRLTAGSHRLQAAAYDAAGHMRTVRVAFRVAQAVNPVASASAAGSNSASLAQVATDRTGWDRGDTWSDSFESDSFDRWSWWGQGDSSYAHRNVIDCRAEGVPVLGGDHVARFETTPDDIANGRYHAKVYKDFGTNLDTPQSRPPADVSGTYSAWYYVPTNYRVSGDDWVNVFQFKEQYRTTPGHAPSDPLWWVEFVSPTWAKSMADAWGTSAPTASRPDAPVAFVNYSRPNWKTADSYVTVPLGRWFEIKAVVHQGQSTDFYMDGKLLKHATASQYPVSPFHGAASSKWIFGVGNYSDAATGPLYVDRAAYSPAAG